MKKQIITILLLTSISFCKAQSGVSGAIYGDAKLTFVGDKKHGYSPGTINLLARIKLNGNQEKHGYFLVFPEFEYAEIDGIYKRYSVNVGYTLNNLVLKNFEVNASAGWGWIDRYGKTMFSFGASSEIAYKITKKIKVSALGQLTERKDLLWLWGKNEIKPSFFIGVEYKL